MSARLGLLLLVFFGLVALLAIPLGRYMARVFAGEARAIARLLGPVERLVYRASGIDPRASTPGESTRSA